MNALRAGAVVLVPLPNGHCGLIWIIETEGPVLRFLLLEGCVETPEREQAIAIRV